jgi:hypothetical protein
LTTLIAQNPPKGYTCSGQQQQFEQIAEGVYVSNFTDPDNPIGTLTFYFTWRLDTDGTNGSGKFTLGDGIWSGGFLVPYAASHVGGGTVTVDIVAVDPAGNRSDAILRTKLDVCRITAATA